MPEIQDKPAVHDTLRPYKFHGVHLEPDGNGQAVGDCPFCGKERKFSVSLESSQWRCLVCNSGDPGKKNPGIRGGNTQTFLRHYYDKVCKANQKVLEALAKDRKLLSWESLVLWGVKVNPRGEIIVPGYAADGKLMTLYRYIKDAKSGKKFLNPTPKCGQHLHGVNLYDKNKPLVHQCEGFWDGVAYSEVLARTKETDEGFKPTGSVASSLLAKVNVLAAPGAGTFFETWAPLYDDKTVTFLYDSDHPKKNGEQELPPVGYMGVKHAVETLHIKADEKPNALRVLKWGPDGYDIKLPSGFDLRDGLCDSIDIKGRIEALKVLNDKIEDVPQEWLEGAAKAAKGAFVGIQPKDCKTYKDVLGSLRKSLNVTSRIDLTLSAMLATAVSTRASGTAQLWLRVIGPPSSGKSTLCEMLNVSKHVFSKSTIKGLFSGYKTDKEGTEDNSLIVKLKDKTFIVKDADSMAKLPNFGEIMSQFRDSFDKTSRSDYKNKMGRDYAINFTSIWAGTGSIQAIDQSDLGERFLSCRIVEDEHNDDLEDDIALRVAFRAARNMGLESNGKAESMTDPKLVEAMQLCGGYLDYLRANSRDLLSQIYTEEETLKKIIHMAQLVSYLRARPPKGGSENVEKEWSARLVEQFVRLATCLAVVLNKNEIDDEVLKRCHKICGDTCRGRVLHMAQFLYPKGMLGAEVKHIAQATHHTDSQERDMLRFLKRIGAVESFEVKDTQNKGVLTSSKIRWRLTPRVQKLYAAVFGGGIKVSAATK